MTSEPPIRIARVNPQTTAEGPGLRLAVWVQGCNIRCDGCFNPHLWTHLGGIEIGPAELAERAVNAGVEGVTLLGGEPFEQADGLAAFARHSRQAGLSVMTFTGHHLADLHAKATTHAGTRGLLEETDLLVDGPYLADRPDLTRPWVGSTNQGFHFLTARYRHIQGDLAALPDRLELRIGQDGTISVNGWATVDQLDQLLGAESPGTNPKRGRVR